MVLFEELVALLFKALLRYYLKLFYLFGSSINFTILLEIKVIITVVNIILWHFVYIYYIIVLYFLYKIIYYEGNRKININKSLKLIKYNLISII